MKPIGSILTNFKEVHLSTADDKEYTATMTPLMRLGVNIFGAPHIWFRMRTRLLLHLLKSFPSDAHMLDAGCGYGLLSMILAEERGLTDITAVDLDETRIADIQRSLSEYKKLENRVHPQVGSLTNLPFSDNTFDVAVSSEVIEHIVEHEKAFSEIARVVKPGGTFILTVPAYSKSNEGDYKMYGHERPGYTRSHVERMAHNNNLVLKTYIPYMHTIGKTMVNIHNRFTSKAFIALFFYPLYWIVLLDRILGIGEENSLIAVLQKNA